MCAANCTHFLPTVHIWHRCTNAHDKPIFQWRNKEQISLSWKTYSAEVPPQFQIFLCAWSRGPLHSCVGQSEWCTPLSACSTEACKHTHILWIHYRLGGPEDSGVVWKQRLHYRKQVWLQKVDLFRRYLLHKAQTDGQDDSNILPPSHPTPKKLLL